MKKGLITVVLPVYNVAQYLDRCVQSILAQTYRDLEIILVDDGSTDSSPALCDKWAQVDRRIRVVHKTNDGLGKARNTGIDYAQGEYICFFDSDDYVDSRTVEACYDAAVKDQADIVVFGLKKIDAYGRCILDVIPTPPQLVFSGAEVQERFLPNLLGPDLETGENYNIWMSSCTCLYSMASIQNSEWRFASEREIISEDVYSLLDFYGDVRCVSVLSESFYFYCTNEASLSKRYRPDRYEKIKQFYDSCVELCQKKGYSEKIRNSIKYPCLSFIIAALKQITQAALTEREKKQYCLEIFKDTFLQSLLAELPFSKESLGRRILFALIRGRLYYAAYCLIRAKIALHR